MYEVIESGHDSDQLGVPASLRIRPGMEGEAHRLHTDRYQVWERARGYGNAVRVLLAEWHNSNVQ
ncbi:hypothetical protein DRB96_10025 [Streptomyces sp. ICC1]|nr:hypothetical protein DRB89_01615 [Streptomyces sp. ICC4]AWZ12601.1 hypothetical protein DRB96_10025 [Streptomyces sp. ICC1]